MSDLEFELRRALLWLRESDGCHGTVTRDGETDACDKPATVIVDGRGTEDETYWPACTFHAYRYGRGRVVPLRAILEEVRR